MDAILWTIHVWICAKHQGWSSSFVSKNDVQHYQSLAWYETMNCVHLYLKDNYSIIGMFLFFCMKSIFSQISLGQCEMKLSQIRTVDGKEYRIPDTRDCEVVMAMDCSSSKQFAVKTKRDSSDSSKQVSQQYILIFFFLVVAILC